MKEQDRTGEEEQEKNMGGRTEASGGGDLYYLLGEVRWPQMELGVKLERWWNGLNMSQ